jgi:F-type H+-transporting ATPase subunit delta
MIKQREYSLVAKSYATALFNASQKLGILQRVAEESKGLLQVVEQAPRLLNFLDNPRVSSESKLELLGTVLRSRVSPILMTMLTFLIKRNRTQHLADILARLQELIEEAEGVQHAVLESAVELNFQDKLRLKSSLEKYTSSRLHIDYQVNPGLLGGLVFRYRDMLVDSSVSHGLDQLRRQLLTVQL